MGGEKLKRLRKAYRGKGSPPHGRGKDLQETIQLIKTGITPAWAGKSQTASYGTTSSGDHPRMGGEKLSISLYALIAAGSPPHGRGKVIGFLALLFCLGITPAWAGKRSFISASQALQWDHPRMGGEKVALYSLLLYPLGSPPHGRGKVACKATIKAQDRITPAWAGKR